MSSQPSFESGSYDDTEIVTIYDDEGRSLDCYIENEIEYTNIIYVLLMPVDLAIIILKEQTKAYDATNELFVFLVLCTVKLKILVT